MKVSKVGQKINRLYDAYKQSPEEGLEPLLIEVYRRASRIFGDDDDAAQNFIIWLVDELPDLVITKSFNAWLYRQLRWRSIDSYRSIRVRAKHEVTPFPITDELGQELSLNESIGVLEFEADQAIGEDIEPDTESIADPAVQKIADLLIMGYTRAEIAAMLGTTVGALKVRITRYKQNKQKMAAIAYPTPYATHSGQLWAKNCHIAGEILQLQCGCNRRMDVDAAVPVEGLS